MSSFSRLLYRNENSATYSGKGQGFDDLGVSGLERLVREKIEDGEITLGKPDLEVGERLLLIDDGCRYAIETVSS